MVNYQTSKYELLNLIFLYVPFRRFSLRQRHITSHSPIISPCSTLRIERFAFHAYLTVFTNVNKHVSEQYLVILFLHSKTVRARELKWLENVHLPPRVMCHMSTVVCHMSTVTCHVSHTKKYQIIQILFILRQSVTASRQRICYQRGLPRLVS